VTTVASPFTGRVVPLDEVADPVFAERVMGDGVAVVPAEPAVVAPVGGTIEKLFPGGHGIALQTPDGVQVLVHVGLETVHLKGDGFTVHAADGDTVRVGDLLVTVDLGRLAELGIDVVSPVVVISGHTVTDQASGEVRAGERLFEVGQPA
jgi:glucose-specific phosphotransferase system IIA component